MLQKYFIPQLEQLNLKHDAVFQQNGDPCHFASRVRQFLNWKFSNRWIGKGVAFCIANDEGHVETQSFF